ncbi:MAG: glycosyltransferase [Ruminococcus sp.]|nr:glycosyltransferase [Ruminococcus sp.]
MTVTFISNFLLHHQTPFCEAMVRRLGDGFRFVATEPIPEERLQMGYRNLEDAPYAVNSYKDDASYQEAVRLAEESDVVIIGSAPEEFVEKRIKDNKLTFRYSERFFKKFRWRFHPRAWKIRWQKDTRFRNKNLYMLCASAYTTPDCRFVFAYPHKTYRWGYFPEISQEPYEALKALKQDHEEVRIIWVSRFIPLKHPEEIIALAKRLKADRLSFTIEMLGVGELREEYENIVKRERLEDVISFSGPFAPEEVLLHMQRSDIFLFTSDKNEGWGAVMNEAMSSACAPVACREIGSVPFLIRHGENGLIYDKREKNSLYFNVKQLIEDPVLRETIQDNAYRTIADVWNAETAAERLLCLIDCIQNGRETPYTYGPCSRC